MTGNTLAMTCWHLIRESLNISRDDCLHLGLENLHATIFYLGTVVHEWKMLIHF